MGSCSALTVDASADLLNGNCEDDVSVNSAYTPAKNTRNYERTTTVSDHEVDITPVKNPVRLKRRSLMREMNWDADTETAKHPMQMRSRKCKKPKKDYCKPEDYVDYAEDLSFLFDDLPELTPRTKRKSRKKRPHLLVRKDISSNLSSESQTKDVTSPLSSLNDVTAEDKNRVTQNSKLSEHSKSLFQNHNFYEKHASNKVDKRKLFSSATDIRSKRLKVQIDNEVTGTEKYIFSSENTRSQNIKEKKRNLKLDYKSADTVTRMSLRRRHSTPTLGGSHESYPNDKLLSRTLSVKVTKLKQEPINKTGSLLGTSADEDSCVDIEFVDSPDSGFGSETSCSAATPDVEIVRNLNMEQNLKVPPDVLSIGQDEEGMRLNLDGEAVLRQERWEREKKKKEEKEKLREKYRCQWVDCPEPAGSLSSSDLHHHLEKFHVENYSCKWMGCKVFGKSSRKLSFLQRHIAEHSGEKPYKCLLEGCDATFSSLPGRKRHVEGHYSQVSYPKAKVGVESSSFSRYLLNSRRIKDKRKTLANRHDCMDNGTMTHIRSALIQNEVAMETSEQEFMCDLSVVTFHAEVVGRKTDLNGKKEMLVRWRPANLIPDEWTLESDFERTKEMRRCDLPDDAQESLKDLLFFGKHKLVRKTPFLQ